MSIRGRIPALNRLDGYEQASTIGILLTVLGSIMNWLSVEATQAAASEVSDLEAGTTGFTGIDLGWGVFIIVIGIIAAIVLGLVHWRYEAPGRKTGLVVMLLGLVVAAIAIMGFLLTGFLFEPADRIEGISVGSGLGILITLLGAILMVSGGILRLVTGPPATTEADSSH